MIDLNLSIYHDIFKSIMIETSPVECVEIYSTYGELFGFRNGTVRAVEIRLINPKAPERCQGVLCSLKEGYGFIERADVVREIFFHYSEYKDDISTAILGEDVEFAVQTRNVCSKSNHKCS